MTNSKIHFQTGGSYSNKERSLHTLCGVNKTEQMPYPESTLILVDGFCGAEKIRNDENGCKRCLAKLNK